MTIQENSFKAPTLVGGGKEIKSLKVPSNNTGTGWFVSAFLMVNAALGAGLLNLPIAFHKAGGIFSSMIIHTVLLVFVVLTILTIAYCSDTKGSSTYQCVVFSICGPKAQLACAVCVLLYCFGLCITCLIIIGDQWEIFFFKVAENTFCKTRPFYMTRAFVISSTSIAFILPLCFPKRIDFLSYASFIGVAGILYVAGLVTIKYFLPHGNHGNVITGPHSWIDVFVALPEICFSYQFHIEIIPIYSCMEKRNIRELTKALSLAMILCVVINSVTATLGYLQFGDIIANDILLSFNPTAEVIVAVVLVSVKSYTTYPIFCFCGRSAFDTVWGNFWKMSTEDLLYKEKTRRIITTLVWFTFTLLLSIFTPNIGVAIQILGSLAAVFIFVFPGLCLLKTMQNKIESGEKKHKKVYALKWMAIVFIIVGAFIFGLTLTQTVMEDIFDAETDFSKLFCG